MRTLSKLLLVVVPALLAAPAAAQTVTIVVPGTSDPWLAGMPDGATASASDVAPTHSPVLVTGLTFVPGDRFGFHATGRVGNSPFAADLAPGPDGGPIAIHFAGAENGIATVTAPVNGLLGLFLGPAQPSLTAAPVALDFTSPASRDYLTLSPLLKQPFFIGDGRTGANAAQTVLVPTGATRLYLATMDGFQWGNNVGSLTVDVTLQSSVPEPASATLLAVGALAAVVVRRRFR